MYVRKSSAVHYVLNMVIDKNTHFSHLNGWACYGLNTTNKYNKYIPQNIWVENGLMFLWGVIVHAL